MKKSHAVLALGFVATLAAGLVIGALWFGGGDEADASAPPDTAGAEAAIWTCPMHPSVQQPGPGDCPICGMDLVPKAQGDDAGPRRVAMSDAAAALARVATDVVERRFVVKRLRLVGAVDFDETRVRTVAARVPGRLERLFVDYTGVPVREGDHLVSIFSPELETAQQELLQARSRLDSVGDRSDFLAESDRRAYDSAREKLREWGMADAQIDAVEAGGEAQDRIRIDSPIGGVVVEKYVHEGDYVKTGTPLFRVAELDRVWVQIDAYEQDLPWIRYGQLVTVTAEAWPGEVFTGRVAFVDPVVDEKTRTVDVRVNVDNAGALLKPGMFVRSVVESRLAAYGRVLDPRLAGKWISPMHPEVVKDGPGQCDVCGMDLVPAEELGFVARDEAEPPLVVPASAVLPTGRRAVVYVEVPDTEKPTYEGREVVLGPRAGDDWIVLAGVEEGERVVTRGAFQIDSALQLDAKPSMIHQPPGVVAGDAATLGAFRRSLVSLTDAYFDASAALAGDDLAAATAAATRARDALDEVRGEALSSTVVDDWSAAARELEGAITAVAAADDLDAARIAFEDWSKAVLTVERRFGHAGDAVFYEVFCPMAFDDKGAPWLQRDDVVLNPYFGASMLRCGAVRQLHPGADEAGARTETRSGAKEQAEVDPGPAPGSTPVYDAALAAWRGLAADDVEAGKRALAELASAATSAGATELAAAALRAADAADMAAVRIAFEAVSKAALDLATREGHPAGLDLKEAHCPMAFDDKGASWLQVGDEILNPYFGDEMLHCGWIERDIPAEGRK